jgi:hypothetical protein
VTTGRYSPFTIHYSLLTITNHHQKQQFYKMTTIKGPGIFLAQFMGDKAPHNSLGNICKWAASLGFTGVQIPTWDSRCIDLQRAAESKTYADEIKGLVQAAGMEITELSTHCRASWWLYILLMMRSSTGLRRKACATMPKQEQNGPYNN